MSDMIVTLLLQGGIRIEIRGLRYFLTVVREGGINRAAEVLHITQPALSRQLSHLEEEVGVKLFHRGARRITLTNEGILLRRRTEEILSLVDRTEKGLIDIGILLEPVDMEKFNFIRMAGNERWVVLMRPDDPLANKEAVSAKALYLFWIMVSLCSIFLRLEVRYWR